MIRYIRAVLSIFFIVIYDYFTWMLKFSRHPEKYDIQVRYDKVRHLIMRLNKYFRITYYKKNAHIFDQEGPFLFICNHLSMYDVITAISLSKQPITFVGKQEIKKAPFVGRLMRILGGVLIDRDNLKMEIKALQTVRQSLIKRQVSWFIFPEGTRNTSTEGELLPFKAGTFKLALDSKVSIVPVAIYGTFRPLNMKYKHSRFPIHVSLFEPVSYEQIKDLNTIKIAEQISDLINTELKIIKQENDAIYQKK